jgi:small subunit ribosomal protein S6
MREYEATIVLSPLLDDDGVNGIVGQITELVGRYGGELDSVGQLTDKRGNVAAVTENWRARKLAYGIRGHREGYYVVARLRGAVEVPDELERWLNLNENVLRFLVLRVDELPAAASDE